MKNQLQLVLLVVFAVATGALGTLLLQSHSAQAQRASGFRECFFLGGTAGWSHINNPQHLADPVGRFQVPQGWTLVGGNYLGGGNGAALFCR